MEQKKETSVVGTVAGHTKPLMATFDATSKRTPAQEKEIKKRKKIMNKTKTKQFAPYNIDEQSHGIIRDTVFEVLLNEMASTEKSNYVMSMFDGINKQIGLSMGYAKTFIIDALKMGDLKGAKKLSFRRARTELSHMQKLIDDMQALVNKIHELSDEPEVEETNEVLPAVGAALGGLARAAARSAATSAAAGLAGGDDEVDVEGAKKYPGVTKKAKGAVGFAKHSRQGTGAARKFNKGVRQAGKKQIRSGE
tara:strand:+ start:1208 stop:1960 length:753 start_codon:yes stop_codon:yes gene_type:complete